MEHLESSENRDETKLEQSVSGDHTLVAIANPEQQAEDEEWISEDNPKSSRRRKRTWVGILGAILLLAGAGFGLRWWQTSNAQSKEAIGSQPPGVPVVVAPVQSGTIAETSDYVASIQSRKSVTLQPQIDGRIEEIFVQPGTFVKAGTPIMQINPAEQQAAVRSSSAAADANQSAIENEQATLRSLQAERQSSVSNLNFSQQQYKRYASLYREGAVTRQQLDEYTDRLRVAQANIAQIDARLKAQQAAIAQAEQTYKQTLADVNEQQVQLQYYRVTAPFSGTVGNIPVKVGDRVTTSTNLANLTENQNLEVNVAIPIERAPELRLGMPVELLNAQGEVVGTSRIFFISPNVNNDTQSVLVKASYTNDTGNLRADQFIRAKVIWDRRPGVLVPTTAISRIAGQDFVFVAETNENSQMVAQQKPVKLGEIQGNNYQVLEGLKAGEEIVTSGIQKLSNGAPIVPES